MNPWTGTWARRLLERMLAERVLTILLSLGRAAGVGAVRGRVLLASPLLVSLLRRAVPRPARPARGHPRLRPAVAGAAVALTRKPRGAVTVGRAASWSPGERGARRERGAREPRSGHPAGTGSAAALATVLPRPGAAAVWPGAGVGIRLPAPSP
jgi:hypothetical protein